MFKDYVKL